MEAKKRISDDVVFKLWNLYEEELIMLLGLFVDADSDGLVRLFTRSVMEKLRRNVASDISTRERGSRLLAALKDSPMRRDAIDFVLNLAKAEEDSTDPYPGPDRTLHLRLIGTAVPDSSKKGFEMILKNLDSLQGFMEPDVLLEEGNLSDSIANNLSPFLAQRNSRESKCLLFIREMPYCGVEEWTWEFWRALDLSSDRNNQRLLKVLHRNFREEYEDYLRDKELRVKDAHFVEIGQSLESAITVHLLNGNIPMTVDMDTNCCGSYGRVDDCMVPEELSLRKYQEELARPAVDGKNTIVCAPTGSGKTWVAAKVIIEHLEKSENCATYTPLVAFLVPTVPLIEQQMDVVKRFLPRKWKLGSIQGGDSTAPKHLMIQEYHVVVMTPQILLNMLRESDDAERFNIERISLLIFDECHHCDQTHPYNDIMTHYMEKKFGGQGFRDERRLQIVGLTASLGVGKKTDSHWKATEHVLKLAANMDAEELAIVNTYEEELKEIVRIPADQCELISGDHQDNAFSQLVEGVMKRIETTIQPHIDAFMKAKKIEGIQVSPPAHDRWKIQEYGGWVHQLLAKVPTTEDTESKKTLMACLEHLRDYHLALELNAHLPAREAMKSLKKRFHELFPKTPIDRLLCDIYAENVLPKLEDAVKRCPTNPLFRKLAGILDAERNNRENFRAIVFVRTRALTTALRDCLMEMNNGLMKDLNVETLTAVNASGGMGGQTQAIQKRILEDFRSGKCRVIVATTVAEEGLDIEECNLVIKYNHVTNEIAMVQRRGRGRAEGSRSVLLALENWIARKEEKNAFRERLMHNAIQEINQMDQTQFRHQVEQRARKMYQDRILERTIARQRRQNLSLKRFHLCCKKCDEILCSSLEIRQIQQSHFVSVNSTIWERVNARAVEPESCETFQRLSIPGKAFCLGCSTLLGNVIKFKDVYFPTLKADAIILQEMVAEGLPSPKKESVKKWKMIKEKKFLVEEIEPASIAEMSRNPPYAKSAMDKLLEIVGG